MTDNIGAKYKCLDCGDVVQSKSFHDKKACTCNKECKKKIVECIKYMKELHHIDARTEHFMFTAMNKHYGTGLMVSGGGAFTQIAAPKHSRYEIVDKEE